MCNIVRDWDIGSTSAARDHSVEGRYECNRGSWAPRRNSAQHVWMTPKIVVPLHVPPLPR
eukprot:scaffold95206_cov33-Tisochrysis_lutea.AAC.1